MTDFKWAAFCINRQLDFPFSCSRLKYRLKQMCKNMSEVGPEPGLAFLPLIHKNTSLFQVKNFSLHATRIICINF